jgi:hypothetical protein
MKKVEIHPVDEFANPDGMPDKWLSAAEARLWLLSKADRRRGVDVHYDAVKERWYRDDDERVQQEEGTSS